MPELHCPLALAVVLGSLLVPCEHGARQERACQAGATGAGVKGTSSPRAQALTLSGPGHDLSPVDLEGIVGKDGNQDDAKNLWSRSVDGTTKSIQY